MRPLADLNGRQLVESALARPADLLADYQHDLARSSQVRRVELLRAAGVAHREQRNLEASAALLHDAHRQAIELGDAELTALVALSLSATVLYCGDAARAVELIDAAVGDLTGDDRFVALCQRAGVLHRAGRVQEALIAFDDAFAARPVVPTTAVAELHNNRGILLGFMDRKVEAADDIAMARRLFSELGSERRAVDMTHNLGWLAGRRGDLVEALQLFDEAEAEHVRLGLPADAVMPDRCEVLLAAGLLTEAMAVAERAALALERMGDAADHAEALIVCAQIALRQRDWQRAASAAHRAAELFSTSGRLPWSAHARALAIEAEHAQSPADDAALSQLAELRTHLADGDLAVAVFDVDLLTARILLSSGRVDDAAQVVTSLDIRRLMVHSRPAARALRAELLIAAGQTRAAWRELGSGLAELHTARASLGATEMRASIGLHGDDVVRVGTALALGQRQSWRVLAWSELGRARAMDFPPMLADPETVVATDRVRLLEQQVEQASVASAAMLRAELATAVDALQRLTRRRHGPAVSADRRLVPAEVRAALGGRRLVQLLEHDEQLWAVVVQGRTARLCDLGAAADWRSAAVELRRCLARVLAGHGDERLRQSAGSLLERAGQRMDELLAPALSNGDEPIVLVATARLHAAPWGAVPSLARRSFVVAPSTALWIAARRRAAPSAPSVAAFAGPRLPGAEAEATRIMALAGGGTNGHLPPGPAAGAQVMAGLQGTDTVHLACHGKFVAENPLLSSLQFADGPLYLYDLERIGTVPRVLVLSACSTALSTDHSGEELRGIVASMLGAGAGSVIASSVPVPDEHLVEAMVDLHGGLAAGRAPSDALQQLRDDHPRVAAAFCCYGAG